MIEEAGGEWTLKIGEGLSENWDHGSFGNANAIDSATK